MPGNERGCWGDGGEILCLLFLLFCLSAGLVQLHNEVGGALVEMWLRGEEEIVVEGHRWFGQNRTNLHRKAMRG